MIYKTNFTSTFKRKRDGIFVEVPREQHDAIKRLALTLNIPMKKVVWLIISLGFEPAINDLIAGKQELIDELKKFKL